LDESEKAKEVPSPQNCMLHRKIIPVDHYISTYRSSTPNFYNNKGKHILKSIFHVYYFCSLLSRGLQVGTDIILIVTTDQPQE
jgi:hypothetical protein